MSLFLGKVLLLCGHGCFNAAYIHRSLELWGASVLTVNDAPGQCLANLPDEDLAAIVICVAVDLEPEAFFALTEQRWPFPVLFVGGHAGVAMPAAYAWMHAPFASYQVIERLLNLMAPPADSAPAP